MGKTLKIDLINELNKRNAINNNLFIKYRDHNYKISLKNNNFSYKEDNTNVIEGTSISNVATRIAQDILKMKNTRVNGHRNFFIEIDDKLIKVKKFIEKDDIRISYIFNKISKSNKTIEPKEIDRNEDGYAIKKPMNYCNIPIILKCNNCFNFILKNVNCNFCIMKKNNEELLKQVNLLSKHIEIQQSALEQMINEKNKLDYNNDVIEEDENVKMTLNELNYKEDEIDHMFF